MGTQVSQQILSHCLQRSLQGCESFAISYSDNVLVFSKTPEEHLIHLDKTIGALKEYGWKISANKSHLMSSEEIILFGFRLSLKTGTLSPDPDKAIRIREMSPPQNRKGIRRFLGSLMYYADMIPNIGEDLANLQELLKTNTEFKWLPEHQIAFDNIKEALASPNFVILPDFAKDFNVIVDGGPTFVAGGIFQFDNTCKKLRPVALWYKKLSSVEQRYSQIEKEALALVAILKTHEHILYHGYSIIHTDARSLTFLKCFEATPKLQRYSLFIQSFQHCIKFSSSKKPLSQFVDMMSRQEIVHHEKKKPKNKDLEDFEGPKLEEGKVYTREAYTDKIEELLDEKRKNEEETKVYRIKFTQDRWNEQEWEDSEQERKLSPIPCTSHKICLVCSQADNDDAERELFDEEEQEIKQSRTENSINLETYITDNTEQGQLLAAVFKESAALTIPRLKKMQRMDPYILNILKQVTNNEEQWEERYCIKDGILLQRILTEVHNKIWVIVLPSQLGPSILHDLHSSIYGFGHPSAAKLAKIAAQKFSIRNLHFLCAQTVNNCVSCLMFKCNTKLPREEGEVIKPRGANHVVHMDFVTIQNIESEYTNKDYSQALVFVDSFTMYTIAIPCKSDLTAAETFQLFLLHWVSPFGPPKKGILCDNAKQFCCELTNLCTNLLRIRLLYISPHKHAGNLAERIHRTLLTNIRCAKNTLNFSPSNWPILLALSVHAHNNAKQVRTNMSPIFAFLGRESHFQLNNFLSLEIIDSFDEFPKNLALAQEYLSRKMDIKTNKKMEDFLSNNPATNARRLAENAFPPRTLVYMKKNVMATDPLHKLRERFEGPYIVYREYPTRCMVKPWKNEDIQKDTPITHILGHGRPQLRQRVRVVDKDRLKKTNGFRILSTALGRDLKSYFIDGTIDLYNLTYTYRNERNEEEEESLNEEEQNEVTGAEEPISEIIIGTQSTRGREEESNDDRSTQHELEEIENGGRESYCYREIDEDSDKGSEPSSHYTQTTQKTTTSSDGNIDTQDATTEKAQPKCKIEVTFKKYNTRIKDTDMIRKGNEQYITKTYSNTSDKSSEEQGLEKTRINNTNNDKLDTPKQKTMEHEQLSEDMHSTPAIEMGKRRFKPTNTYTWNTSIDCGEDETTITSLIENRNTLANYIPTSFGYMNNTGQPSTSRDRVEEYVDNLIKNKTLLAITYEETNDRSEDNITLGSTASTMPCISHPTQNISTEMIINSLEDGTEIIWPQKKVVVKIQRWNPQINNQVNKEG